MGALDLAVGTGSQVRLLAAAGETVACELIQQCALGSPQLLLRHCFGRGAPVAFFQRSCKN
jgi:hypothetical protein